MFLGAMYRYGDESETFKEYSRAANIHVTKDFEEAAYWFRKAATAGSSRWSAVAQRELGLMYFEGEGVPKDYAEAARLLKAAVENGDVPAGKHLALLYFGGLGVPKDVDAGIRWIEKSADHGDTEAQYTLYELFTRSSLVPTNDAEAVKWLRKAAEAGDIPSQRWLAYEYLHFGCLEPPPTGINTVADLDSFLQQPASVFAGTAEREQEKTARSWKEWADRDEARAEQTQNWGAQQHRCIIPANPDEGRRWLTKVAERTKDANDQYMLGSFYEYNLCDGVWEFKTDHLEEALRWYRKAAEQGHVEAPTDPGTQIHPPCPVHDAAMYSTGQYKTVNGHLFELYRCPVQMETYWVRCD